MQRHEPIYIAGHNGLVGSALLRNLRAAGYSNLVTADHRDLDLTAGDAVRSFFQASRPAYVFLAAARVGGILANSTRPAEFIVQNLGIELNVIREAYAAGVKRLLFLGSSCVSEGLSATDPRGIPVDWPSGDDQSGLRHG